MQSIASAVNQKAAFAELLLQAADDDSVGRHLQQALLQSAALQLGAAYRFFLAEIGAAYQCKNPAEISELSILLTLLQAQGKSPSETTEIGNLDQQPSSWLGQLRSCCKAIESLPQSNAAGGEPIVDTNRIAVHAMSEAEDWSLLTNTQLRQWLGSFGELVERHRQSMVEW